MSGCGRERGLDWLEGALAREEAAEVEAHARGCEACTREKQWIEAEAELFASRRQAQPPVAPDLWSGVAARLQLAKPEPKRQVPWRMLVPLALAAAAALLILVRPSPPTPSPIATRESPAPSPGARPRPIETNQDRKARKDHVGDPEKELARAEAEDCAALEMLEAEYMRRHHENGARWNAKLAQVRGKLAEERRVASGDIEGRMALLGGTEEYMHSLIAMVEEP
jgi:hypothetical protein